MYSDDNSQSRKNRKEYTMGNLKWPEGKKCAVMFTFDVDGDTTWENGNRGLPNGEKYIKSLSVGQYGPKRCVDRILDMLESYGVKATFFVPGLTAERYPEVITRIAEAGHEIGHHGYAHERFAGKTTEEQIEIIEKTQAIFKNPLCFLNDLNLFFCCFSRKSLMCVSMMSDLMSCLCDPRDHFRITLCC